MTLPSLLESGYGMKQGDFKSSILLVALWLISAFVSFHKDTEFTMTKKPFSYILAKGVWEAQGYIAFGNYRPCSVLHSNIST